MSEQKDQQQREILYLSQGVPATIRFDHKDSGARLAVEVTVSVVPAPVPPEYFKELARQVVEGMRSSGDTIALGGAIGPLEITEAQYRAIILAAGGDPDATGLGE